MADKTYTMLELGDPAEPEVSRFPQGISRVESSHRRDLQAE